jgi:hypothetical protein
MTGFLPAKRLGSPYRLKREDVTAVRMRMAMLADSRCAADNRLGNALRRFDDIHGRNRDDETIIDCFTALESCLTTESSAEIGYRLALRAAAVLVGTHQPEDVRILVSAGYDARSKIVHEGLSMRQLFSNKDFKKKLKKLKEVRGLDVIDTQKLVNSLDDRIAAALRYVEPLHTNALEDTYTD